MWSHKRLFDIHGLPIIGGISDLGVHAGIANDRLWRLIFMGGEAYATFRIPKKSGSTRPIASPNPLLKKVQRWILRNILEKLQTTPSSYGFFPGSKLRFHAEQHLGSRAVLTLDIENFFSSISIAQVVRVFRSAGYSSKGAWILARLCTLKGTLPQGAPSSPRLANLACFRMDRRLARFSERMKFVYTRYSDDLTFSSISPNALAKARSFIAHIVHDSGFKLNSRKSRLAGARDAKVVTGLVLSPESAGIGRQRLRELRAWIHRVHVEGRNADLSKIQGWLNYLSDVDPTRYRIVSTYVTNLRSCAPSALSKLRIAVAVGG
jgi:RNA-directed DNA polymerase